MQELMGDVTPQIALHCMNLVAPMASASVLLDNGCGNGGVTQAVIETQEPGSVIVYAIDIGASIC